MKSAVMVALMMMLMCIGTVVAKTVSPAPQPAPEWNPESFPISYWCGPPQEFVTQERVQQIADAGFTYMMPPCGPSSVEVNKKLLDYAEKSKLKVFIGDGRLLPAINNDP